MDDNIKAVENFNISNEDTQKTVTIKVRPNRREFTIDKGTAMRLSDYFQKAFDSDRFLEGKTGVIISEDIKVSTFAAFSKWLTSFELPPLKDWATIFPDEEDKEMPKDTCLAELYVFADRFIIPALKNSVTKLAHGYYTKNNYRYKDDRDFPKPSYAHCHNWDSNKTEEDELLFDQFPLNLADELIRRYAVEVVEHYLERPDKENYR